MPTTPIPTNVESYFLTPFCAAAWERAWSCGKDIQFPFPLAEAKPIGGRKRLETRAVPLADGVPAPDFRWFWFFLLRHWHDLAKEAGVGEEVHFAGKSAGLACADRSGIDKSNFLRLRHVPDAARVSSPFTTMLLA
jgi:hypothetical protein